MTDGSVADPRLQEDEVGAFAVGRVPSHGLRVGGEAYLAVDCYLDRCSTNVRATTHQGNGPGYDSVRGAGHAVCECGALSPHLFYGSERRWWHRRHKARVLLGQPEPAGQPRHVAPEAIA